MFALDLGAYKAMLALLTKTLAAFAKASLKMTKRKRTSTRKLKRMEAKLGREIRLFLSQKEECSFYEGLIFTANNAFIGFSIENGIIKGDLEKAKEWASRYYRDDVDLTDSNQRYFYEVACYVLALALYQ